MGMQGYIYVPQTTAALTVNGTNRGVITVASTTNFYVGQKGWLRDADTAGIHVVVLQVLSSTTLLLGLVPEAAAGNYTQLQFQPADVSVYTTAQTATLFCYPQIVKVYHQFTKPA